MFDNSSAASGTWQDKEGSLIVTASKDLIPRMKVNFFMKITCAFEVQTNQFGFINQSINRDDIYSKF